MNLFNDMIQLTSPDLENNSTCWDFKHNAKGGK